MPSFPVWRMSRRRTLLGAALVLGSGSLPPPGTGPESALAGLASVDPRADQRPGPPTTGPETDPSVGFASLVPTAGGRFRAM